VRDREMKRIGMGKPSKVAKGMKSHAHSRKTELEGGQDRNEQQQNMGDGHAISDTRTKQKGGACFLRLGDKLCCCLGARVRVGWLKQCGMLRGSLSSDIAIHFVRGDMDESSCEPRILQMRCKQEPSCDGFLPYPMAW
jgi:hypothetical protein